MFKAFPLTLLLMLLGATVVQAQTRIVKGRVLDASGPLYRASVGVAGSANGTFTDEAGNFSLSVPAGSVTLVISSVGYTTLQRTVEAGEKEVTITLEQQNVKLGEVVVTALGIGRKTRSLVYATQTVKPAELTEVRDPNNVLNSFQGKIPNAFITQGSGGVGSPAKIVLRGNRSIQGTNSALIVLDGVPIYNSGFDNMASNINPDDIESVSVLRGASAAALYGSQAGNGVIVITTKKGVEGKLAVTYNAGVTVESPFSLPRVQNRYGQGNMGQMNTNVGESWGAEMNGQSYTDHFGNPAVYSAQPKNIRDFFRTGLNLNNAIGISAGNEKMQGYLSLTNNTVQGIIPNNDLRRNAVNLRLSNQLSKRLSTDAKITYFTQQTDNKPRNGEGNTPVLDIYQISRNVTTAQAERYMEINELGVPVPAPWPSTLGSIYGNPYWVVNMDNLNETRDQVMGFISAKYQIVPWLSVTGRANLDRSYTNAEQKTYQGTLLWATKPGGYYSKLSAVSTQQWYDVMFSGDNALSEKFRLNYNAGAIYQKSEFDQTLSIADGLNVTNKFSPNFATAPQIVSSGTAVITQSVFGQANFSYADALYLDASVRNDWDSRLPAPHSFTYYSAGLAAIISDLAKLPEPISFLKASINYAEVGNGGQFGLLAASYDYVPGAGNGYLFRKSILPFPQLKPEIVKNLEAGIEARFLQNRLGLAVTYYKANSLNQLLTITIPVATGYSSQYINAGNIRNQGVEFVLTATPLKKQSFNWDVTYNLAFNRNKVIALSDELKLVNLGSYIDFGGLPQVKEGGSYGDMVAHRWARNENGQYLVTAAGKPLTTDVLGEEPGYIGNFNPKATMGLTNNFSYKGISLRVLVDGRVGGIVVSGTEQNLAFSGITEGTEAHREGGWNLGGVDEHGQAVTAEIDAQGFWQTASGKRFGVGEFFAYDATSFRVREVSLGYNIPLRSSAGIIKSVKISAVGRNLAWLYRGKSLLDIPGLPKRKMWMDPDMGLGIGNTLQGVEYGAFPSTRSVGLNLNVTF
ncbi:SusC/RagA family TonB-linked outer membrane protein [Chitinophaga alhagiae]|uniref:SusC/RagA family TonB-linked outer membrane protein n=1 Tax=Chitinophaga alhagiae TaxID=2203219 RepID=A0ABN5LXC7_9BACT|nr:SusC/RagA family TonB-linked outer membrane protein [Chitinophaga alhagiae]AWO00867.1 SusC/RagA family TonB-linked outer membrane protein [Chitinophaga alhagiae]